MAAYVFLDIDGVLNHFAFWKKLREDGVEHRIHMLCPVAMGRLNTLLVATGAKVVVSSTWRLGRTIEELQSVLEDSGFKGEVVGMTMVGHPNRAIAERLHRVRGDQIANWVAAHMEDGDRFVIFDDDSDMGPMLPWLVQTTPEIGLLDEHVEAARQILMEGKTVDEVKL